MNTPKKIDGGPAFPMQGHMHAAGHRDWQPTAYGMSLRDYFAAQAIPGITAGNDSIGPEGVAADAYAIADAMLAERSKP